MSHPVLCFTNHTPGINGAKRSIRCMVRLSNLDQVEFGVQPDGTVSVDVHHEPLVCIKEELKNEPESKIPEIISLIDDDKNDIPTTPPNELQEQDPVSGELTNDDCSVVSDHTEVDKTPITPPRQFKKIRFPDETKNQCRYDMNTEPEKTITPAAIPPAIPPAVRKIAALTPDQISCLEEALREYKDFQQLQVNPYPVPELDMDNMSVLTFQTRNKSAPLGSDSNSWKNKDLIIEE